MQPTPRITLPDCSTCRSTFTFITKDSMSVWLHILLLLKFFVSAQAHPLETSSASNTRRDLTGLFGDAFEPNEHGAMTTLQTYHTSTFTSNILGGTAPSETATLKGSATVAAATVHSIIGKLPSYGLTSMMPTMSIVASPTTSLTNAPPATAGLPPEAPSMPIAEAMEWKVIGLVVICIAFVATVILSVVFFDSWWAFLRDLILGKRNKGGAEDMVPDWEKRSWEFKLANEDGHRYPTIASLEDITKDIPLESLKNHPVTSHLRTLYDLESSNANYPPDHDPHPLDPLVRRPSTRPIRFPGIRT